MTENACLPKDVQLYRMETMSESDDFVDTKCDDMERLFKIYI